VAIWELGGRGAGGRPVTLQLLRLEATLSMKSMKKEGDPKPQGSGQKGEGRFGCCEKLRSNDLGAAISYQCTAGIKYANPV
jgi:hypothetical protein